MFNRKDSVPDSPTTSMIKNIKKPPIQILEERYIKRMMASKENEERTEKFHMPDTTRHNVRSCDLQ
jgi:hypothetical protein